MNYSEILIKTGKINWNGLSCFERSLAICCETYVENSTLLFLILKAKLRDNFFSSFSYAIGTSEYYNKLLSLIGLELISKETSLDKMDEAFQKEWRLENRIVVYTNTIYQSGSKGYLSKNHPHFVYVDNMSSVTASVIDEDWEGEYWKPANAALGVVYKYKEIERNFFNTLATSYNMCLSSDKNNENAIHYYIIRKAKSTDNLSRLVSDNYLQNMRNLIYNENYYVHAETTLRSFYEHIEEAYEKTNDEVTQRNAINDHKLFKREVMELKNRYIYPFESEIIACHHFFIDAQRQAYLMYIDSWFCSQQKQIIIDTFKKVLLEFEKVKIFIARDIMAQNNKSFSRVEGVLKNALDSERNLYRLLVDSWIGEGYEEL